MLEYIPQVMLADSFGSSEAVGFGSSITTKDAPVSTAKFTTNDFCKVFDENDNEIPRGGTPGFIAFGDPCRWLLQRRRKNRQNFQNHCGVWYSIPGDYCLVAKDGTLTLPDVAGVHQLGGRKNIPGRSGRSSNCMTAWKTRWLSVCR